MKRFLLTWAAAAAGFALVESGVRLVELATRPPEQITDRAAAAVVELVLLDAELRGDVPPAVVVPPKPVAQPRRRMCLAPCCHGKSDAAAGAGVAG